MEIGIIGGTGPAGTGLGLRLASIGHQIVIGSRSVEKSSTVVAAKLEPHAGAGLEIRAGTNLDAADCDMVVLATPWHVAAPTAAELGDPLAGKLVICMANALARVGNEFYALYPPRGSIAADVAAMVPRSRVAAAFHHLPAAQLARIDSPMEGDVLVCADDYSATEEAIGLVNEMGNLRGLDCGTLANAAPVEAFTAVLLRINATHHAQASIRITGLD